MLAKQFLNPKHFRQHTLLVFLAPFGTVIFALLTAFNALHLQQYAISGITTLLSLAFLTAWLHYKFRKDLLFATRFVVVACSAILVLFIYINHNQSFGLVWAILYPPLIMMAMGHQRGLKLSIGLYLALTLVLLFGQNDEQSNSWDMTTLIRFSLSYIAITYMTYVMVLSNKLSYGVLHQAHAQSLTEHSKIKKLANHDETTGVYSRQYLMQAVNNLELNKLAKHHNNLLFFIVQINGFKHYVDHYGYMQGDQLLVDISKIILQKSMPVNGQVFRINGSQFAGLVICKDIAKALTLIKEIQSDVEQLQIPNELSLTQQIDLSIGITVNNDFAEFNFNEVFKNTDKALYKAYAKQQKEPYLMDSRQAMENLTLNVGYNSA